VLSPSIIGLTDDVYVGWSVLIPDDFPRTHKAGAVDTNGTLAEQCLLHSIYGRPYGGSSPQGVGLHRSGDAQEFYAMRNASYATKAYVASSR
jgi:hypothetical protein